MELDIQYKALLNSLKLVACSFEDQQKLLPKFVDIKDEVLNTFFESFLLLPSLIENNYLSVKGIAAIIRLNNWIDLTELDSNLNDIVAFKESTEWNKIRLLARAALDELNEGLTLPDFSSTTWISD